jgi:predicted deacylase
MRYLLLIIVIILTVIIFISYPIESFNAPQDIKVYDFYGKQSGPFVCIISGVHGNEPSGPYTLLEMLKNPASFQINRGHLRIIPVANEWGYSHNNRFQSYLGKFSPYGDINRNFNAQGGTDNTSRHILTLVKDADLILDIHDGYDFHCANTSSVGSTLTPSTAPLALQIARDAVAEINKNAIMLRNDKCTQFLMLEHESCKIPSTLACWAQKNNKAYILAEITGQSTLNQLPINIRDKQVRIIIKHATALLT